MDVWYTLIQGGECTKHPSCIRVYQTSTLYQSVPNIHAASAAPIHHTCCNVRRERQRETGCQQSATRPTGANIAITDSYQATSNGQLFLLYDITIFINILHDCRQKRYTPVGKWTRKPLAYCSIPILSCVRMSAFSYQIYNVTLLILLCAIYLL